MAHKGGFVLIDLFCLFESSKKSKTNEVFLKQISIFHFLEYEVENICKYFNQLNDFIAHYN